MNAISKVLLISPPVDDSSVPSRFVSFGIVYIAMVMRRHGYNVELMDIDTNRFSMEEVRERIIRADPDIVGIGGLATVYPYLHWLVPEVKRLKPGVRIILGGAVASSLKERCFERFDIDYEVIGEGEITIIELMKEIESSCNLAKVRGIGYRENGRIVFTESRPLMESLDDVPIIDYSLLPMDRLMAASKGVIQVHAQRGCPSRCTFCFNCFRVVSNRVRYRPFKDVLDEIELLRGTYNVKLFALMGECITMNKEWIIDFCRELIKRRLNISYRVTSRVDTVDEERLVWLKKSGCASISFGLESGSKKILSIMKKGTDVERARNAVYLARKYIQGIEASIMLGYIGENEETLTETLRFCKDIKVKPLFFYATPFPGTELYRMAMEKGCIADEEAYLLQLGRASILKPLHMNLTDMAEEKAMDAMKTVIQKTNRHYFYRAMLSASTFRKVFLNIRTHGLNRTIGKIKGMYLS